MSNVIPFPRKTHHGQRDSQLSRLILIFEDVPPEDVEEFLRGAHWQVRGMRIERGLPVDDD